MSEIQIDLTSPEILAVYRNLISAARPGSSAFTPELRDALVRQGQALGVHAADIQRELAAFPTAPVAPQDRVKPVAPDLPNAPRPSPPVTAPVSASPSQSTSSTDLIVSARGGGQFRTIGEALAKATPGARILIYSGEYGESLTIQTPVDLIADTKSGPVVIYNYQKSCLTLNAPHARIQGITFRCRIPSGIFPAVEISKGSPVIEQCRVESNTHACVAVNGAGVSPAFSACTMTNSSGTGIIFYSNSGGTVEQCEIRGELAGIEIRSGANPHIHHCRIREGGGRGVIVSKGGRGLIEDCDLTHNARGAWLLPEGSATQQHRNRW